MRRSGDGKGRGGQTQAQAQAASQLQQQQRLALNQLIQSQQLMSLMNAAQGNPRLLQQLQMGGASAAGVAATVAAQAVSGLRNGHQDMDLDAKAQ